MLCHAELLTGRSIRLKDQRRLICKAMRLITQAGYQNTAKVMILLQHGCYCMIFCWKSKLVGLTITIVGPRACDQFEVPHILSKQDFKWMQMNPKWMQHCATHCATQRLSSPFFAKRRRPIVNVATLPTWCLTRGFGDQNFAALGKAGAMMDGGYVFCFTYRLYIWRLPGILSICNCKGMVLKVLRLVVLCSSVAEKRTLST